MNALQQFLIENPVDNLTESVKLTGRLKDFDFKIKAMNGHQYNEYQTACIKNPTSPKKRSFDTVKFNELIVINHVVDPNFKDADWLKQSGCVDSKALLYKTLLAGEIATLASKVLELSGFEGDVEDEVEEIKN